MPSNALVATNALNTILLTIMLAHLQKHASYGAAARVQQGHRRHRSQNTVLDGPSTSRTLIVTCGRRKKESYLAPFYALQPYDTVDLQGGENPPALDDKHLQRRVILVHSKAKECINHPFYRKALELFNESPRIPTPADNVNKWVRGVFSPRYIKEVKNRPLIVRLLGELFWEKPRNLRRC